MQVTNLKATPNPLGGQIDISWTNPDYPGFMGVKILRRESTYPDIGDIGTKNQIHDEPVSSTPAGQTGKFSDLGLKSETTYYYAIIVYDSSAINPPSFVSAMTTTAYETAVYLYKNLPSLYHSFDDSLPPNVPELDPKDKNKGQLQRLTDMFGLQFDLIRSFAGGLRNFYDIDRIDGSLLPLLAQWIGWQTDFTLSLAKQRNEIKYAPHYYRTVGVSANLRATINRLITWDVQIKEFVHNIWLSNNPEQLAIWDAERRNGVWKMANKSVTLDIAYEGKPSAILAQDGRHWIFYHARQTPSSPRSPIADAITKDIWHIWYKAYDQYEWLPSHRITYDGEINKYPAALQKSDKNIWLFWSAYEDISGKSFPQIKLKLMSAGQPNLPAHVVGTQKGPFAFADGDKFEITVDNGIPRTVTLHNENFFKIGQVSTTEIADLLNREIPGVEVKATEDNSITLMSLTTGKASTINIPISTVATKLGLANAIGRDASPAELIGERDELFSLIDGDELSISIDGGISQTIVFHSKNFVDITKASATEVANAINLALPGIASADGKKVKLISLTKGEKSCIVLDVDLSKAASKIGFGAPLPSEINPSSDTEPAVFEDNTGNVWLFWTSQRTGSWNIWYNRFDITSYSWGTAKPLTNGIVSDYEPTVVFDTNAGRIWVFWSRKKDNGLWSIFYRTTTNLNFDTQVDADWTQAELAPIPTDYDNKEPSAILTATDSLELYFSSNRTDGWNVWSKPITSTTQGNDVQITSGQFTRRAPAVLKIDNQLSRLWFRSNENQIYNSSLYPSFQTTDSRYAGSTTIDTRNLEKISLQRNVKDILHYTYDTLKEETDWYARDTIGIYLTPDIDNEILIIRKRKMIESVLKRFLPIQVRAVLIIQQVYNELVYTYDNPDAVPQQLIGEQMIDTILSEVYQGMADSYLDSANFQWVRLWDTLHPKNTLPDLSVATPDLSFRLFLKDVAEGE